jgi:hypothetical protein
VYRLNAVLLGCYETGQPTDCPPGNAFAVRSHGALKRAAEIQGRRLEAARRTMSKPRFFVSPSKTSVRLPTRSSIRPSQRLPLKEPPSVTVSCLAWNEPTALSF